MDVINASTGSATTSCGHTFHFNCLANWCIKKVQSDDHQNCPLCRHEMVESERLPEPAADEEEEDDDDYTDRDEEEEDDEVDEDFQIWQDRIMEEAMARASRAAAGIPEFDEAAHALWVMRTTFERLDDGESIDSGGPAIINQKVALPSLYVVRNRANSL
jgi:Ring finger domain